MWLSLIMIATMYLIPLVLYIVGVPFLKFVLAFLCGLGIIIHLSLMPIFLVSQFFINVFDLPTIIVLIINALSIVVNLIWFFIAFRTEKPQVITQ